jgi:hypothetical protein
MNIDETDCVPLLESTRVALREEALQMLLIPTQQTNLELCISYDFLSLLALIQLTYCYCREDSDDDVAFVDCLPSSTSVVQDLASAVLPSRHQRVRQL